MISRGLVMNKLEPKMTRTMLTIFIGGNGSAKISAPARMGTTAPIAALNGITKRARPREKATCVKRNAVR